MTSAQTAPIPAYETKDEPLLEITIANRTFSLAQSQDSGTTGSTLWLSAQVLCEYLAETLSSRSGLGRKRGKLGRKTRSLELGSGIGLSALVMRELGFEVTATDIPSTCEDFLRPNIEKNTLDDDEEVKVMSLDWLASLQQIGNQPKVDTFGLPPRSDYDYLVGSDLVYEDSLLPGLCRTLSYFTGGNTVVYIAQEIRVQSLFDIFLEECQRCGLRGAKIPPDAICKSMRAKGWRDEDWDGVEIWKLRRKS